MHVALNVDLVFSVPHHVDFRTTCILANSVFSCLFSWLFSIAKVTSIQRVKKN